MLDPDVVLRADHAAVQAAASNESRGAPTLSSQVRSATAVADAFSGRAQSAQPAFVNGAVGAVWAPGGRPRVAFSFTITRGQIVEISVIADPERPRQLDLTVLND